MYSIAPIEWYSMDDFRKMADVNLWGMVDVTKTFLPLVKKTQGRIVNIASVSGKLVKLNRFIFFLLEHRTSTTIDSICSQEHPGYIYGKIISQKLSVFSLSPFKTKKLTMFN